MFTRRLSGRSRRTLVSSRSVCCCQGRRKPLLRGNIRVQLPPGKVAALRRLISSVGCPVGVGHDLPAPREAVTEDVAADALVIKIEDEGPVPESSSRPAQRELKVSFLPPPTFARRIRSTAASLVLPQELPGRPKTTEALGVPASSLRNHSRSSVGCREPLAAHPVHLSDFPSHDALSRSTCRAVSRWHPTRWHLPPVRK